MNKTWKTIIAVIVITIVVGGGVYLWQQNANSNKASDSNIVVLYQDNDYHIKFTTSKDCKDFYSIKTVEENMDALRNYGVFVPGSSSWPKDSVWYHYSLYTQATYDKFSPNELPGKPQIELRLSSGELLTLWSPQDGPSDTPNCKIEVKQF